jgi:uncharacterized protein (TIGR02996 family)
MAKESANTSSNARLFEFRGGGSDKFWEITVVGAEHTVRYGRVGTDGQSKTKSFPSEDKASAAAEKLISQKTGKGYSEVLAGQQSRTEKVKENRDDLLEHAPFIDEILSSPDELGNYAVYADWLSDRGDPRGEFIHVQLALEDESLTAAKRKKLQTKEKSLLKKHERDWLENLASLLVDNDFPEELGEYVFGDAFNFKFARGFLDTLEVAYLIPLFAKEIEAYPHIRMLRQLVLADVPSGDELVDAFEMYEDKEWDYEECPGLAALGGTAFDNLRKFQIGDNDQSKLGDGAERLLKRMPKLQSLHLEITEVDSKDIFRAKLPELRELTVLHLSKYDVAALAKNKCMSNLESIHFHPHAAENDYVDNAFIDQKDVSAICKSKNLGSLRNLTLNCADVGDKGLKEIVDSGLLKQLAKLELSHAGISDEGAELLVQADSELEYLGLKGSYLSAAMIKALKKSFGNAVDCSDPMDASRQDGKEHLYSGDME